MAVSPKQKMSSVKAKRGRVRPRKNKLIRKKASGLDKMTLLNQVYIVPKEGSDEVNGALGLVKFEASIQEMDRGEGAKICEKTMDKSWENYRLEEENVGFKETTDQSEEVQNVHSLDNIFPENDEKNDDQTHSESNLDPVIASHSEVMDEIGIRLCDSVIDFKQVRSFEDFKIVVNGLIINSELPKDLQMKYYELCCSQKSYLHDHLLEGLNCNLVVGIISQTVNIADAIRASEITTPQHRFETWNQTLKCFEELGMKVGFIRARSEQLMSLSLKLKRRQANAHEEKRKLEAELQQITEALTWLDGSS